MYLFTTDKAMLGFPSLAVGVNITSEFLIRSTAFNVSKSGSPGPHPTQKSFICILNLENLSYLNQKLCIPIKSVSLKVLEPDFLQLALFQYLPFWPLLL